MTEYQAQVKFNGKWSGLHAWHEDLDYARDALKSWLDTHNAESRICLRVTIVLDNS